MQLRNVAIIAHVDHGKTTLVDGLLKQSHTFRSNEAAMSQDLIMDSNDQERERGITILAKNTAVNWTDPLTSEVTKINIIDTPGHADFGGEVERTLNMADAALLVIDAQEGPMPQTKFVLKKALEIGLKVIVIVNKIDKRDSQVEEVIERTHDLFLDLATDEAHLDFPVYYAIGREGKAWAEMPEDHTAAGSLRCIFEAIVTHVPAPHEAVPGPDGIDGPLQMLVSTLDRDNFQGKHAVGRIRRGTARPGMNVTLLSGPHSTGKPCRIEKVYVSAGLKRLEVDQATAGDIVHLTGIKDCGIGDTIADITAPEALPTIHVEEPTLKISVGANTSPFAGREGQFVTSRQILERIERELETNVSMRMERGETTEFILSGRGELHLSVFIEQLRREGFELQVGKPQVITKWIDGEQMEPMEELTIDVATEHASTVTAEVGRRKGILFSQTQNSDGSTRLTFEIATRGLLGLRNLLLTISRGTAIMNSLFLRYEPLGADLPTLRNGVLIASETGKAVAFGLLNAQERGTIFVPPQTQVYQGMIVGINTRMDDIEINVAKQKQLTNMRAAAADSFEGLTPPTILSLEQSLDFLEDDELLEVTPDSLRLRKKLLNPSDRAKARRQRKGVAAGV